MSSSSNPDWRLSAPVDPAECPAAARLASEFGLRFSPGDDGAGRMEQVADPEKGFEFDVHGGDKEKNQKRYI